MASKQANRIGGVGLAIIAGIGILAFGKRPRPDFPRQFQDGDRFAYVDNTGSAISTYTLRSGTWSSGGGDWVYRLEITSGPEDGSSINITQADLLTALAVTTGERLVIN